MMNRVLGLMTAVLAMSAGAQAVDGGMPVEPRAANPDSVDNVGELVRELESEAEAAVEAETKAAEATESPAAEATPAGASNQAVEHAFDASEEGRGGRHGWRHHRREAEPPPSGWDFRAGLHASLRVSYQGATPFPFDATLEPHTVAPLLTRLRAAPELHLGGLGLIAEADAITGAVLGAPDVMQGVAMTAPGNEGWPALRDQLGRRVPYPSLSAVELRKLYLEYRWRSGAFRVGQQTSHWGLGLLANDGDHAPRAGDFGQQQFGSLVYRALLAARPLFEKGGAWRAVETAFAADLVVRDGTAEYALGDRAFQGVVALRFAKDERNQAGLYVVYRDQSNVEVTDGGKQTRVFVFDFAGNWEFLRRRQQRLTLGWEFVGITGTTTQARSTTAEELQVRQYGFALKSAYRHRRVTVRFDAGLASGDQNPLDDRVENLRFDRDYKVGLILFDQVLGYQTARGAARAADPGVLGRPPEGVDVLGTGGAVTGAWYLFPRLQVRALDWLDVYGGPLFAFSSAKLTDPFNTNLGGGTSVNALGGEPGSYLGTEVDLGVQARFHPVRELEIQLTGEGGLFVPGDAFSLPDGQLMGPVGFGRIRVGVAL